MTPLLALADQWPCLSHLLDEALSLPPERRSAWLDGLSGTDAELRSALEELLSTQAEIETGSFLERLPALLPPEPADEPVAGALIGPYRLLEPLGEGGMGLVWQAERADGLVKRRVALKLPRGGWGGGFAERLARERDILASLDHENIARLYDAGVDARGRPYIAMELVDGEPITAYCDHHRLSVRERVALVMQVAAAVSHAHARLVVHRDLKPGNILVGAAGRVRLLDFGIAKLLEGGSTRASALTEISGRALTIDYASPEQIAGRDLGTGSDVYSLAVVAYELLTRQKPYRLKRGTAAQLEEAIASAEVTPASAAASDAATRRQLQGDLDAILNRALKKRPEDRYPTMDAFAQDLRCYLAGAPVQARPDGMGYRTLKFVRRHRLQVAAGGAVVVALVAGTSVALWQAQEAWRSASQATAEAARARVEAATSKAVQDFLASVFEANTIYQRDPRQAAATTARELLDRGAERIGTELASEPEAQRRLYYVLGEIYGGMWQHERALTQFRQALDLATRLHGADSDVALRAAAATGHVLDDLGRRDEALQVLLKADAAGSRRASDRDGVRVQIDTGLARIYMRTDVPKALERARRAGAIARAQGPSPEGIDALQILGEAASTADRPDEARSALTEAIAWSDRLGARGVQGILLAELGKAQDRLGQVEAAQATLARAVAVADQLGDSAEVHNARFELSRLQVRSRMWPEALQTLGSEVPWARTHPLYAPMRQLPAFILATYGRVLVGRGDPGRGLATVDEAIALLPPEATPSLRGQFFGARASALLGLGRVAEARAEIDHAMAMMAGRGERVQEEGQVTRRRYLVAVGKAGEALSDFRAHARPAVSTGAVSAAIAAMPRKVEEATLLLDAGDLPAAQAAATSALASLDLLPERRFAGDAQARLTTVLGEALQRQGRIREALPVLRRALVLGSAVYDPTASTDIAHLRRLVAQAERQAGKRSVESS
jgi:tetratricopeptide (TPR) repeat protein